MRSPQVIWIVVALALVAVTQGSVEYVCAKNEPRVVRPLRRDLAALPSPLGDWVRVEDEGENDIDPKVLNVLGADHAVTTVYQNSHGRRCSVHLACWYALGQWTPHPPDLCYGGAGFTRRQQKVVTLLDSSASGHDVRWAQFASQNGATQIEAMYWYQIGDNTFFDRASGRPVMHALWGKPERPPLIKVLMQTNDIDSPKLRESLERLAGELESHVATL